MDLLIKLSLRNIKRNKRRSLLAILSISLSIMLVVILKGMVDGIVENIIKNSTKNETGHIRITHKEYLKDIESFSIHFLVERPKKVIDYILSDKNIAKNIYLITERIKFFVILHNKGLNKTAICLAGDIDKEKNLLMLNRSMIYGEYLRGEIIKKNKKKFIEVIIGSKLAEILNLKVGDTFSLMLERSDYGIKIPTFYIRGIFKTGLNILDENFFMMNIEDAKNILKTQDSVCEILIMLKKHKEAKKLKEYINLKLSQKDEYKYLIASDWHQTASFIKVMDQAMNIYNFLYLSITFLGSFIIANIILMIIIERKTEIGILRSMGFKVSHILFIFTLEGTILGFIGSIFGALLGILVNIPLSIYGIDFSSSMSNLNYPIDNVIKWSISLQSIVYSVILGVVVCGIMSFLPSLNIAKIKVIDAIKNV